MPNDVQDWTIATAVQLVSSSGAGLGDSGGKVAAPDTVIASVTTAEATAETAALASFKPAGAAAVALVGVPGAFTVGSNVAVTPPPGQASTAGNALVAVVTAEDFQPTTVAAGWAVVVLTFGVGKTFTAIWAKLNCGAGEAAPAFTSAGSTQPMFAQLFEFSGVALAAATDRTGANQANGAVVTVTAGVVDAAAADLVVFAARWANLSGNPALAAFAEAFNNSAAVVHAGDSGAVPRNRHSSFAFGIIPAATTAIPLGERAWDYDTAAASLPVAGSQATVTLAANTSKAWRVARIAGSIVATTAAAQRVSLTLVDGATTLYSHLLAVQALINEQKGVSDSGLGYKGTVNTAMVLSLQTPAAGGQESVSIAAYLQ